MQMQYLDLNWFSINSSTLLVSSVHISIWNIRLKEDVIIKVIALMTKGISKYSHLSLAAKPTGFAIAIAPVSAEQRAVNHAILPKNN